MDEGFFLLVFLKEVRNRAWRSGFTQKQAEEIGLDAKEAPGEATEPTYFYKEAGSAPSRSREECEYTNLIHNLKFSLS